MTPIDLSSALAAEHIRDLQHTADRRRLAVLVRCCQPATWRRAATRARGVATAAHAWVLRGQLRSAGNYYGSA
jgi:hypothetical protein